MYIVSFVVINGIMIIFNITILNSFPIILILDIFLDLKYAKGLFYLFVCLLLQASSRQLCSDNIFKQITL